MKSDELRKQYGWPAMMRRATVAAYLELSIAGVEREVIAGVLPSPVRFGGKEAWSKKQIDVAIERLVGDATPGSDWRRHSPLYADQFPGR